MKSIVDTEKPQKRVVDPGTAVIIGGMVVDELNKPIQETENRNQAAKNEYSDNKYNRNANIYEKGAAHNIGKYSHLKSINSKIDNNYDDRMSKLNDLESRNQQAKRNWNSHEIVNIERELQGRRRLNDWETTGVVIGNHFLNPLKGGFFQSQIGANTNAKKIAAAREDANHQYKETKKDILRRANNA